MFSGQVADKFVLFATLQAAIPRERGLFLRQGAGNTAAASRKLMYLVFASDGISLAYCKLSLKNSTQPGPMTSLTGETGALLRKC